MGLPIVWLGGYFLHICIMLLVILLFANSLNMYFFVFPFFCLFCDISVTLLLTWGTIWHHFYGADVPPSTEVLNISLYMTWPRLFVYWLCGVTFVLRFTTFGLSRVLLVVWAGSCDSVIPGWHSFCEVVVGYLGHVTGITRIRWPRDEVSTSRRQCHFRVIQLLRLIFVASCADAMWPSLLHTISC